MKRRTVSKTFKHPPMPTHQYRARTYQTIKVDNFELLKHEIRTAAISCESLRQGKAVASTQCRDQQRTNAQVFTPSTQGQDSQRGQTYDRRCPQSPLLRYFSLTRGRNLSRTTPVRAEWTWGDFPLNLIPGWVLLYIAGPRIRVAVWLIKDLMVFHFVSLLTGRLRTQTTTDLRSTGVRSRLS